MLYESQIEATVVRRALQELGIFSVKMRGVERGWPDRMFLLPKGRVLWIEFKRPGGAVAAYQTLIHERLQHFEHVVQVHDNVDVALRAIEKAKNDGKVK